jgi:glycosyltransferase involved in cell wall biosynthesis
MKIAYISNYLGHGFLESYCIGKSFSISATLKSTAIARAMIKAGHEVTVFSPGITVCNQFIKSHSEIIDYPEGKITVKYPHIVSFRKCSLINSLLLHWNLINKSTFKEFDSVLFYNITLDAALNLHLFKNKLRILEYEDNIFNNALKGNKYKALKWKNRLFQYVINRTDSSIIVGKGMLKNFPSIKKVQIPGAISEDVIENISIVKKMWDGTFPIIIALAGGVHYSKGADLIIRALDYIEYPVELRFYGSGIFDKYTKNLIENTPKKHSVKNVGFVKHNELIKILGTETHILINSTRNMGVEPNSEGYPFKMLEYAAIGRPIVSSTIGRLDDEFNDCISFYDCEDPKEIAIAIMKTVTNYDMYCEKAVALQKRVINEFSINGISEKVKNFLKEIS